MKMRLGTTSMTWTCRPFLFLRRSARRQSLRLDFKKLQRKSGIALEMRILPWILTLMSTCVLRYLEIRTLKIRIGRRPRSKTKFKRSNTWKKKTNFSKSSWPNSSSLWQSTNRFKMQFWIKRSKATKESWKSWSPAWSPRILNWNQNWRKLGTCSRSFRTRTSCWSRWTRMSWNSRRNRINNNRTQCSGRSSSIRLTNMLLTWGRATSASFKNLHSRSPSGIQGHTYSRCKRSSSRSNKMKNK